MRSVCFNLAGRYSTLLYIWVITTIPDGLVRWHAVSSFELKRSMGIQRIHQQNRCMPPITTHHDHDWVPSLRRNDMMAGRGISTGTTSNSRISRSTSAIHSSSSTTPTTASSQSIIPTIDFSIVAFSGLTISELDVIKSSIETACEQGLGLMVSVTSVTPPHTAELAQNQEELSSSSGIPGTLGRVVLLKTNLDIDSIETVEYAISEQIDCHLYAEPPLLRQPILIKIHNPLYSNIDFERCSTSASMTKILQLIVQDEVDIYQLNRPLLVDDSGRSAVVEDDHIGDITSTTTKISSSPSRSLPPPSIHVELDAAMVRKINPKFDEDHNDDDDETATWWDTSTIVVWDDLVSDDLRKCLLDVVVKGTRENDKEWEEWDDVHGPDPRRWTRGGLTDTLNENDDENDDNNEGLSSNSGLLPPQGAACWGLRDEAIEDLCFGDHPAILEFEKILAERVFPQFRVCRLPEAVFGACVSPLTANAPTYGDHFDYHIDGDPMLTPPSPWTDVYGRYPNRHAGKPRFVSCLIYLNDKDWKWGAPTRFLDLPTSQAYEVFPKPGRVVVMDQDVSHTVVAPDADAGQRPRYSLVWKLILHPRDDSDRKSGEQDMTDLRQGRSDWPEPILFGSASSTIS